MVNREICENADKKAKRLQREGLQALYALAESWEEEFQPLDAGNWEEECLPRILEFLLHRRAGDAADVGARNAEVGQIAV